MSAICYARGQGDLSGAVYCCVRATPETIAAMRDSLAMVGEVVADRESVASITERDAAAEWYEIDGDGHDYDDPDDAARYRRLAAANNNDRDEYVAAGGDEAGYATLSAALAAAGDGWVLVPTGWLPSYGNVRIVTARKEIHPGYRDLSPPSLYFSGGVKHADITVESLEITPDTLAEWEAALGLPPAAHPQA